MIAPRTITRPSNADEPSIELSPADFSACAAQGHFALHWTANGLQYGIGIELDTWLADGAVVIVNGSRQHLAGAWRRYPALSAVEIRVDPAVLRARLYARGRESVAAIEQRLQRAVQPYEHPPGLAVVPLQNDGPPTQAAAALLGLARRLQGANALAYPLAASNACTEA